MNVVKYISQGLLFVLCNVCAFVIEQHDLLSSKGCFALNVERSSQTRQKLMASCLMLIYD